MAKEKGAPANPPAGNVVPLNTNCCVSKCGKKSDRMNFCAEHYTWFKEGLVNKKGERPPDFDKKYQAYMLRTKKAA
jgi:hypothetical protein